jgi:uncharacterized protein (TIGR00251 family)
MKLIVKLQPRASKNEIIGFKEEMLWVRLTAPPVENKANMALIEFLADELNIKKSNIRLISGGKSRIKTLEINGITESEFICKV